MKNNVSKIVFGIILVAAAILLTTTPLYTSVKELIVNAGGSIGLAIATAWGLISVFFVSGIILLINTVESRTAEVQT